VSADITTQPKQGSLAVPSSSLFILLSLWSHRSIYFLIMSMVKNQQSVYHGLNN
jgi:hypothetical protein